MRKNLEREKQEEIIERHMPEFFKIYETAKNFMDKDNLYNYPSIYSTLDLTGGKEKLLSFMIDFSLGFALFYKGNYRRGGFYFTASCSTIDPDFDYPSAIPMSELSFWLPRLIMQNRQYEKINGYR